jgi:hypothetical protein
MRNDLEGNSVLDNRQGQTLRYGLYREKPKFEYKGLIT